MSMVINLVEDHNIYLCEGGPVYNGGVQPTPIYLTQWKIVGNSEVHTLPYPDGVVLPTGYKRCKYLRNDGTAYIEVPFGFDKTDEVYLKGAFTTDGYKDKYMVSPKVWNDDTNRFGLGTISQNREGTLIGYISCSIGSTPNVLQPLIEVSLDVFEFEYKDYICRVGNSSANYTNATFGSTTQNLRLFYGHNATTKCKIYEYRHKKGNTEYRLIPCLDSNDTPCMYDVINNQAYYNSASSGSFTYELYPQPTEIWSCGEYNPIDGKWHILVQPQEGSIADIALTEPLRKVNDIADTIEFADNVATVTRNIKPTKWNNIEVVAETSRFRVRTRLDISIPATSQEGTRICLSADFVQDISPISSSSQTDKAMVVYTNGTIYVRDTTTTSVEDFYTKYGTHEFIYILDNPTTELVNVPQIAEAESYSMVISQGSKAVSWSSFETE